MQTRPSRPFISEKGHNLFFTFCLVSSLFVHWGFCNGMIDVMDQHFQEALHLSLAQSAWVQFAHYLGYFLMALPASAIANRLGYKGAIIMGVLIFAVAILVRKVAAHKLLALNGLAGVPVNVVV